MLKRLLVGLLIGLVVGGLAAAAIVQGLHVVLFGSFLAYTAALATGAFVALVAGKPIWAKGAWIEVGLKAFFGSLLAAGVMFALRKWVGTNLDLSTFHAGAGAIGSLPAASLPIIATVLSVFFEIDNTESKQEEEAPAKRASKAPARVAAPKERGARVAEVEEEAEEEAPSKKKMRS
jgi:hypothetical protein